jgi:HEPN domain-containing protein
MSKETARKWYKQALHDLEMAEKNIEIGGYDISAFLSHQCVEKLLKAGLILDGKKVTKTHYIDELAEKLNLPDELIHEIYELTSDYILSRYPDVSETVPYEQYSEEIAKEKLGIAKKVLNYFKKRWGEL